MDKPNPLIHRFLISTTSRFTGVFESADICIDQSRNYFILSVEIDESQKTSIRIPNYSPFAEQVCTALSFLFGKRFDSHGRLLSHQSFFVPDLGVHEPTSYYFAAPYSHAPRKDVVLPLELNQFASVAPLFTDCSLPEKFVRLLFAAGRFYLRAGKSWPTSTHTPRTISMTTKRKTSLSGSVLRWRIASG